MQIIEMTLPAVNLEEMRQFYIAILGMHEIEPFRTGRLAIQAGGTRLNFIPALPGQRPRYHFAFDVPADRFDAAVQWLSQRRGFIASAEGETRFHGSWNADMVYFYDTAGNVLELIARLEKPPQVTAERTRADDERRRLAERPFNASEIVAVTEIGVAVGSVPDAVAQLISRMPGLEVYSGAGEEDFTAVGDLQGLLIVVRQGRIWFPNTGVPADLLPLDLLLEVEEGNHMRRRYHLNAPPFPFNIQPAQ